jgi:hypothetical protein
MEYCFSMSNCPKTIVTDALIVTSKNLPTVSLHLNLRFKAQISRAILVLAIYHNMKVQISDVLRSFLPLQILITKESDNSLRSRTTLAITFLKETPQAGRLQILLVTYLILHL